MRCVRLLAGCDAPLDTAPGAQAVDPPRSRPAARARRRLRSPSTRCPTSSVPTASASRWRRSPRSSRNTSQPARSAGSSSTSRSPAFTRTRSRRPRSPICAGKQGAFWPMHDLLYRHQDTWAPLKEAGPFFLSLADSARISKPTLLTCVKAPETLAEIKSEAEGSQRAGRPEHADVLHRGWTAGGRASVAGVQAGARLDLCARRPRSRSALTAATKNTSYSAWVQAVIPSPRVR